MLRNTIEANSIHVEVSLPVSWGRMMLVLRVLSGYFGATLGLLWGYFGATLGLLWGYFGATLGML